jgi:hypothetical protein
MRQATSSPSKKQDERQKGAVAVEMAIILPLLATLLLGILEIGSMARDHQLLQNAAREGARFSALERNSISRSSNPSGTETIIKNRIIAYLQNENISVGAGDIVIDQSYPISIGALTVEGSHVTVTYNRSLFFPGITNFIPLGSLQLTGNAVFRNFYD